MSNEHQIHQSRDWGHHQVALHTQDTPGINRFNIFIKSKQVEPLKKF